MELAGRVYQESAKNAEDSSDNSDSDGAQEAEFVNKD